jgi:hypothetical protein
MVVNGAQFPPTRGEQCRCWGWLCSAILGFNPSNDRLRHTGDGTYLAFDGARISLSHAQLVSAFSGPIFATQPN